MISLCQSFILSTVNLKAVKFLQFYVINILLLLDVIKDTFEHLNLYHRQLLRQYDKETTIKVIKSYTFMFHIYQNKFNEV